MAPTIDKSDYKYLYSTVKIEGYTTNHTWVTGTGFYYNFQENNEGSIIGIVTNKHVLENVTEAIIKIILSDANGNPDDKNPKSIEIKNISDLIVSHPEDEVDLCMIPLGELIDPQVDVPENWQMCIYPFSEDDFLSEDEIEELTAIEDVIMIGYPDGLIDEANYKPIIRKGITATHLKFDYENSKEFLIDMCCFSGSSGSPVFLHKYGHFEIDNDQYLGIRTKLIGILY